MSTLAYQGDKMKVLLAVLTILISSQGVFAKSQELQCIGDLLKNDLSRRTHLSLDTQKNVYRGYRGTLETGGIHFEAKLLNQQVSMKIMRDGRRKKIELGSAKLPLDSGLRLSVSLEEGVEATILCTLN